MATPFANEQLSAFLDGELSDAERNELEAALQASPELRAELDALESAVSFLRRHGPVSAPEGFRDRVLAAVAEEPMPGGWWRWLRRPFGIPIEGLAVAAVAALVLLVALPVTMMTGQRDHGAPASDPFAYDKGQPTATTGDLSTASEGKELAKKEKGSADTGSAVADVDPPPPAPRPSPRAAAKAAPPQALGEVTSTADAEPTAQQAPTKKGADSPPGVAYRYDIVTYDQAALASLQRIAAMYRGQVTDSRGRALKSTTLTGQGTYYVRLPAPRLAEFGDALRDLGAVTEVANDDVYAQDILNVRVNLTLMPVQAYEPAYENAAPATDLK